MNKTDIKRLEQIKKSLGVTTIAENVVVEHLFKRDLNRGILLISYGTIKEKDGWVLITSRTNKHSFNFNVLASELENGDDLDLWHKID